MKSRRPWLYLDELIAADPVKGAFLSPPALPDHQSPYRYALWRVWDSSKDLIAVVMLNPSTADARADDATIRRLVSHVKRAGYGGMIVVNLYAWRAREPRDLLDVGLMVAQGADNDEWIDMVCGGRDVLVAWGANPGRRGDEVAAQLKRIAVKLLCLGVSKDGHPRHPLYVSDAQPMEPWTPVLPATKDRKWV